MIVAIDEAESNLTKLLASVERGEAVVITRGATPVARLTYIMPPTRREFGALRGKISLGASFFAPLPIGELRAWGED
jgi:prevent-host-death family protein